MDDKISIKLARFLCSPPFLRCPVRAPSSAVIQAVRPLRHSSAMASDPFNSASTEDPLQTLISRHAGSAKSGVEGESVDDKIQENQAPIDGNPYSICVICFSDDGKADRGKLDSCDHYFCFVCIMEWARIESRCPACKGRFSSVHRIPNDGCRLRQRVVKIPVRNQDHLSSGNTTNRDPYAETRCTVCKGMEDEGHMLLCDLCDSAAHTYCVGLGANVPEGDWFCHDCSISRAQHADTEDTSCNDQNQIETATVEAHTSIFDIVRESSAQIETATVETPISIADIVSESSAQTVGIPRRRGLSHSNHEPPPIDPSRRSIMPNKSLPSRSGKAAGTSARTLHRCRNIHGHIRALRENWGALRRGSLNFPSSSSSSHSGNSSKQDISAVAPRNNQTGQPLPSTTTSLQPPSQPECNERSYDVEKAWRMMEIAKAKAIREGEQTLKSPASRQINTKVKDTHTAKDSQQYKIKKLNEPAKDKKEMGKYRSPALDKQLCHPLASKKNKPSSELFPSNSSSHGESSLGKLIETCRVDITHENGRNASNQIVDEVPSSSTMTKASGKGHAAREADNSLDAKSEIQTLVKINLKLLSRDKNLGYERYKEVARLATHTIMAACGHEPPPKSRKRFLSCSVCSHTEETRKLHRSTLMPNSCRECFLVFVKDIVNALMLEKLGVGSSS